MLWREPFGDASFYSPSKVLQEVHTDLIFLSTISLNWTISFPERCQFSLLDQVPVLAQLINSSLLWKDKGHPYTNTHTVLWARDLLSGHSGWSIWGCRCSLRSLAMWSCWLPCEWAVAVQGTDQLEKWSPLCFAGLLLSGSAPPCYCSTRGSGILQSGGEGSRAVTIYLAVEPFELSFFTGMCIVHWSLDFMSVCTGTNILHLSCYMG